MTSLLSSSSQILILNEIVDQRLPTPYLMVAQDIFFSATIASACLHARPKSQSTLKWASHEFLSRKKPIANPLHAILLWQLNN